MALARRYFYEVEKWINLDYLQHGTQRQRQTYTVLQALGIWTTLAEFGPVLAGTIPLNIDILGSDLDVLCEVPPAAEQRFSALLRAHYGHLPGFRLSQHLLGDQPSIIGNFAFEGAEIEVFAQAIPAVQQHGFRHLLVEQAVLEAGGETWRQAVQRLKEQGLKTEPAFAALLHLPGNPYEALLTLESKTPAELQAHIAQCSLPELG
jgi:hypothetical protein